MSGTSCPENSHVDGLLCSVSCSVWTAGRVATALEAANGDPNKILAQVSTSLPGLCYDNSVCDDTVVRMALVL